MTAFIPVAESVGVAASEYETAYQSASNTLKAASRIVAAQTYVASLPSLQMGSRQILDLPMGQLLSTTVLVLKLDKTTLNAATYWNLRGNWGYDAIQWIQFEFGGSEKLLITGRHMLQKHLSDCESGSKRVSLVELGGEQKNITTTSAGYTEDPIAYIPLYLPFSNVSSARVIPFDGNIINRPVRITVQFASYTDLFCVPPGQTLGAVPRQFSTGYIQVKTAMMKDPADSIKDLVGMNGSSTYNYGYQFPLNFESSEEIGAKPDKGNPASVRLSSLQNGSISSISLWLELYAYTLNKVGQTEVKVYTNTSTLNRNYMPQMRDITVLYAGQIIHTSQDQIDRMFSLSEYPVDSSFTPKTAVADITNNTNTPTEVAGAPKSFWYQVMLSQFNDTYFSNLIQTGVTITSNQLEVRFNTPPVEEILKYAPVTYGANSVISEPIFKLHANVNYQASIMVAKGEARTVFQPPVATLAGSVNF